MSHILETLGVSQLRLRGRENSFNGFDRFFASQEDAEASLADGDYVPVAGRVNAILTPGGILLYSFDLDAFVAAGAIDEVDERADHYMALDGNDDYLKLDAYAGSQICRFDTGSTGWAVGFTVVSYTSITDSAYMNIIKNGDNAVMLVRGSGNAGIYFSSNGTSQGAGANTWFVPATGDRILLQSDAGTGMVQYWVNGLLKCIVNTSSWADNTDTIVSVGDGRGFGEYGHFGIDNMVIIEAGTFGTVDRIEYFDSAALPEDCAYYANLTDLLKLDGDGTTLEVTGKKGVINGDVVNGVPGSSFLPVPTS